MHDDTLVSTAPPKVTLPNVTRSKFNGNTLESIITFDDDYNKILYHSLMSLVTGLCV